MTDVFSKAKRSKIMAGIHGAHTLPEKAVRSFLRQRGFRFRLHSSCLPGKPDFVIPDLHVAIFVNGCFWHGHTRCKRGALPTTRVEFWQQKISGNVSRDRRNASALRRLGWRVITVWQCQLTPRKVSGRFARLMTTLSPSTEKRAKRRRHRP